MRVSFREANTLNLSQPQAVVEPPGGMYTLTNYVLVGGSLSEANLFLIIQQSPTTVYVAERVILVVNKIRVSPYVDRVHDKPGIANKARAIEHNLLRKQCICVFAD